jgi:hypothetical protein
MVEKGWKCLCHGVCLRGGGGGLRCQCSRVRNAQRYAEPEDRPHIGLRQHPHPTSQHAHLFAAYTQSQPRTASIPGTLHFVLRTLRVFAGSIWVSIAQHVSSRISFKRHDGFIWFAAPCIFTFVMKSLDLNDTDGRRSSKRDFSRLRTDPQSDGLLRRRSRCHTTCFPDTEKVLKEVCQNPEAVHSQDCRLYSWRMTSVLQSAFCEY